VKAIYSFQKLIPQAPEKTGVGTPKYFHPWGQIVFKPVNSRKKILNNSPVFLLACIPWLSG